MLSQSALLCPIGHICEAEMDMETLRNVGDLQGELTKTVAAAVVGCNHNGTNGVACT